MSGNDMFRYLPQILAVLIDRAGGTIELSDKDAERIHNMGTVELEFWKTGMFTGPFVKIRYNEVVNIQGAIVPTSRFVSSVEELEALPHGTVVLIAGLEDVLTMNRQDLPEPYFQVDDGSWLRCNNVFSFYGVDQVMVQTP